MSTKAVTAADILQYAEMISKNRNGEKMLFIRCPNCGQDVAINPKEENACPRCAVLFPDEFELTLTED